MPSRPLPSGIFAQVDVDAAGERESDDQRRRHQVVGADFGVDAAFEVAVSGEHRSDHQFFLVDGLRNFVRQRPGVADAGGASVADEMEFQFLQIGQSGRLSPDSRAQFSIPGASEVLTHGGTVSPFSTAFLASSPAPISTEGFEVLVQEVIAAMTTLPCFSESFTRSGNMLMNLGSSTPTAAGLPPSCSQRSHCCSTEQWLVVAAVLADFGLISEGRALLNDSPRLRQDNAILRTLRPSQTRLNGGEIEREQLGVFRLRSLVVMEHPLLAAVSLDQRNLFFDCVPVSRKYSKSLFINRKNSASRSVLRRHIRNGRAISQRQIPKPRPEILDKLPNNAMLPQHLRNGQNEISSSSPFAQPPRKLHPHHQRNQHRNRLPQHRRLGFNPPHSPTQHPQPIHHRRVTVRAYQGVGVGGAFAVGFVDEDYAGQVFEVDLVDDAGVGGDDGEIAEAGLSPAEEGVALFVALEFEQGVHVERLRGAEFVDLDGVVDDQLNGLQGIDQRGVAAQRFHGVAHGGEVDYAGNAGEILEEDAAGGEGDFFFWLRFAVPVCERAHFFFGDVAAVFGAEEVFEKDPEGERQMSGGDSLLVEGVEAVDFVFFCCRL